MIEMYIFVRPRIPVFFDILPNATNMPSGSESSNVIPKIQKDVPIPSASLMSIWFKPIILPLSM